MALWTQPFPCHTVQATMGQFFSWDTADFPNVETDEIFTHKKGLKKSKFQAAVGE